VRVEDQRAVTTVTHRQLARRQSRFTQHCCCSFLLRRRRQCSVAFRRMTTSI
jgi:hypothetical protein